MKEEGNWSTRRAGAALLPAVSWRKNGGEKEEGGEEGREVMEGEGRERAG